ELPEGLDRRKRRYGAETLEPLIEFLDLALYKLKLLPARNALGGKDLVHCRIDLVVLQRPLCVPRVEAAKKPDERTASEHRPVGLLLPERREELAIISPVAKVPLAEVRQDRPVDPRSGKPKEAQQPPVERAGLSAQADLVSGEKLRANT